MQRPISIRRVQRVFTLLRCPLPTTWKFRRHTTIFTAWIIPSHDSSDASMPSLREFSAWIVSEGGHLHEYLVTVDQNASKVSCWIPCEVGNSFSVHWRDLGTRIHSCAYISLDGFQVPGRFLCGYGEASRAGIRTGSNTERPFVFMGQSSTSSGGQTNLNAGAIVLKIRLVAIEGARSSNKIQILPDSSGSQSSTSSHYIGYGKERRAFEQSPQTWNVKDDESGNRSYVTFVFEYRSREFLVSQGIMPMGDALQIPPAVKQTCALTCQVASDPHQAGNSMSLTPSPTTEKTLIQMGVGLQNALNLGSVAVRATINATRPASRFPGEGIIDFSKSTEPDGKNTFWLEKWATKGQ